MLVRVQISPACPKCDKLLEELFRAGIEYGFEVLPEVVETEFEVHYTKDEASKIYREDWIQKYGSEKQKKLLKEAKPIVTMIGRASVTPVIEIRWNYGLTDRSIVIKGFRKDVSDKAINNLIKAILILLKAERAASVPLKGLRR